MATYVSLYNFTDQGIRTIKDTLKRVEAAKKAAWQAGVQIKEVLWLQGPHDLVVISEAADEIASTAFTLNTYKMGNIRGQTFRAFTAAEMEKTLEKVALIKFRPSRSQLRGPSTMSSGNSLAQEIQPLSSCYVDTLRWLL